MTSPRQTDTLNQSTPGPWLCQSREEDGSVPIVADNLGGLVGAAHCWPTEVDTQGSERVDANARLMAAAPDGLELAQEFLAFAKSGANFNYPAGSLQKLEQFIAKATA